MMPVRALCLPLLVVLCLPLHAARAQIEATDAKVGVYRDLTRLTVDFTGSVPFKAYVVANPYRVIVDVPAVKWRISRLSRARGLVTDYRLGAFSEKTGRVVVDLARPAKIVRAFVIEPSFGEKRYQFVLDLQPTTRKEFLEMARRPPPLARPKRAAAKTASDRASPKSAKRRKASKPPKQIALRPPPKVRRPPQVKPRRRAPAAKPVIVIDPGHGGVDPGAIGYSGTREKVVTLRMARVLRARLRRTGRYKVVMTRNRDIFVRLRQRIAIARRADGDLFISIHADSIRYRAFRGASVYTLSERASDKEAAALARKENKADVIAGVDLTRETGEVRSILIDLAQRETMNHSVTFAKYLIGELGRKVRVVRRTHRFAGFAVLKAPDVPSVLVELGYLSNPREERLLRSSKYHARVSAAVVRAIDRYFAYRRRLSRS